MSMLNKTRSFVIASILAVSCLLPQVCSAGIAISITVTPPILPVYVQPPCPVEGYLWTPGYWAWGDEGYYWVPGVWVAPPQVGVLWTPGYWGYAGGIYLWHAGYWGPHVGFYGGVNYGFGYGGVGFFGGVWSGGAFRYNTAVVNVNTTVVRNVYVDRTVINNTTIVNNRASFNGPGGISARPTPQEQAAMHEQHFQPTSTQFSHQQVAARDRSQLASFNHGQPSTAAMDSVNGRRFNPQGRMANVNNRVNREDQQSRNAQGVRSAPATPGEAARAEHREQNVNRPVNADHHPNGGSLPPAERKNVSHQQSQANHPVAHEKHNEKGAPK